MLQRVAADVLFEFGQRHKPDARGEVTAGQLRRAVDRMRDGLTDLRQGDLRDVAPYEWEAAVETARSSLTGAGVDLALVFDAELDPGRLARIVEARGRLSDRSASSVNTAAIRSAKQTSAPSSLCPAARGGPPDRRGASPPRRGAAMILRLTRRSRRARSIA